MKFSEFVEIVNKKLGGTDPDIFYIDVHYPEDNVLVDVDFDKHADRDEVRIRNK